MEQVGGDDDGKDPPKQASKKMKFVPKVKKKKDKKGGQQKKKSGSLASGNNAAAFQDLMQAAQAEAGWEGGFGQRPKDVKMGSVAFGARSIGGQGTSGMGIRNAWGGSSGTSNSQARTSGGWSTAPSQGRDKHETVVKSEKVCDPEGKLGDFSLKKNKDKDVYLDPQVDYDSYYPTILSKAGGDEYEERKRPLVKDLMVGSDHLEDGTNAMRELGLDGSNTGVMLFQLPGVLPVASEVEEEIRFKKKSVQGKGQGVSATAKERIATKPRNIPSGKIGKLLVFKSGKVKMRIGETLLDVSPGVPYPYRQDAVAVHEGSEVDEGHCMFMGSVGNKAVCTLDVYQLLSQGDLPDFKMEGSNPQHIPKVEDGIPPIVKTEYQDNMDTDFKMSDVFHREDGLPPTGLHRIYDGNDMYVEGGADGVKMETDGVYGLKPEQSG